jgi:hypothetical protein
MNRWKTSMNRHDLSFSGPDHLRTTYPHRDPGALPFDAAIRIEENAVIFKGAQEP